jgi:choline-glycine betaine transporter
LQINSGLSFLTPIAESVPVQVAIVATVTAIATVSVVLGLDAGIKRLSNANIVLAVGLLIFVAVAGPTLLVLNSTIQAVGGYVTSLPELAFWTDARRDSGWQNNWTVFYWAWTITWAPFVGIFIARISKGRTIRQFVLGVLLAPTAFTIVWFSTFGFAAIDADNNSGGQISQTITESSDNVPLSLFLLLENYPFAGFVSGLAVLIIVIFFVTSSDSASFVVDLLSSRGGSDEPPVRQRVFWAVTEGAVAATLLVAAGADGLEALEDIITVLGLPFFFLGLLIIYSLLRALRSERLGRRPDDRPRRWTPHSGRESVPATLGGGESPRSAATHRPD